MLPAGWHRQRYLVIKAPKTHMAHEAPTRLLVPADPALPPPFLLLPSHGPVSAEPCCICGEWLGTATLEDVTGVPVPKEARRFLNTTLDTRFLCRAYECQRKFGGKWGQASDGGDPAAPKGRHGGAIVHKRVRADFFQPSAYNKPSHNKRTSGASKPRSPGTDGPTRSAVGSAGGPAQTGRGAPSSKTPARRRG